MIKSITLIYLLHIEISIYWNFCWFIYCNWNLNHFHILLFLILIIYKIYIYDVTDLTMVWPVNYEPVTFSVQWPVQFWNHCFLEQTFPKTSLFHNFRSYFRALNFSTKMWLQEPLREYPDHHLLMRSLNPSILSHISSNLKGVFALLNLSPSRIIREWLEVGFGMALWFRFEKRSCHSSKTKKWSSLEVEINP